MKFTREDIIIFIKQNIKTILLSLLASVILACLIFNIFIKKEVAPNYQQVITNQNTVQDKTDNQENEVIAEKKEIIVDIKGSVKYPGVYEFEEGARIKDAIDKAGGLLEDADTSTINLSQKLKDQMMIFVAKIGEVSNHHSSSHQSLSKDTININLATKEELMKISGIGETKAKAIIDYRKNKGSFEKIEDITKVKGIGKSTFEKIKDDISV